MSEPFPGTGPRSEADQPFHYIDHGDELPAGQRWSSWTTTPPLNHGPQPRPDWVITTEAIDTDLGGLKSGKEADCFVFERATATADPTADRSVILVAKRYRGSEHRLFHRNSAYTEGRRGRNSRDARALARRSEYGRKVDAHQWAYAEWDALKRLWQLGVPVPYPVQIDGLEIVMEFICDDDGEAADRLAGYRGTTDELADLWQQLTEAMRMMTRAGLVHGDLSAYNILIARGERPRLVLIDVPQLVDLIANPNGFDLLHRDCINVADWFVRRGLTVSAEDLFAGLLGEL